MIERAYDADYWFTGAYQGHGETVAATACIGDDNIEHARAYTISGNNITEQQWNGDERVWKPGSFSKQGIAVAAASWVSANGATHDRVYVVGNDHKLTEYWWNDDQWSVGDLSLDNVSAVGATAFVTMYRPASGPARSAGGPSGAAADSITRPNTSRTTSWAAVCNSASAST